MIISSIIFIYICRTHEKTYWIVFATIQKIVRKTVFMLRYCISVVNSSKCIIEYIRNLDRVRCYSIIIFKMFRNV